MIHLHMKLFTKFTFPKKIRSTVIPKNYGNFKQYYASLNKTNATSKYDNLLKLPKLFSYNLDPNFFIECKDDKILKHVIDHTLDKNISSLIDICTSGNVGTLKYYIEKYNISIKEMNDHNLIFYACKNKDASVAKNLIKRGININDRKCILSGWYLENHEEYDHDNTYDIFTPLYYAYINDNMAVFKLLIKHNANINTIQLLREWETNLIHVVCKQNKLEYLKLLVEANCEINIRDNCHMTPMDHACKRGNTKIIKYLIDNNANYIHYNTILPIHWASLSSNEDALKILLENGANINSFDFDGYRPIHYACRNKNIDVLKLLLENNADLGLSPSRKTPLHYACELNNIEAVRLLSRNSDVNVICQYTDKKPLDLILQNNDNCDDILNMIDSLDSNDECELDVEYIIGDLMQLRVIKNDMKNKYNDSIHIGVLQKILKIYVKNNTIYENMISDYIWTFESENCNINDKYDMNIYHYACIMEDIIVIKIMLQGEKYLLCEKDKFGNTPLHYVCMNNNLEIFNMMQEYSFVPCMNNLGIKSIDYSNLHNYDIYDMIRDNTKVGC